MVAPPNGVIIKYLKYGSAAMLVLLFLSLSWRRDGIISDSLALVLLPLALIGFAAFTLAIGLRSMKPDKGLGAMTVVGLVAVFVALAGTVVSYSVVIAGGTEGFIYFLVNISLALTGVILVVVGSRPSQSEPHESTPSAGEPSELR
ncbi:hypothetical protein ESZ53_08570 [Salinibacterium sp. UTAS2018]|uniref:hypothetical protein n=1 Tax=Salinibacterium sp. UTAS2018 TaxID=2508880 RepID=UPI00100955A1|nr:hypothetical protein [Salinibacterium sp. UTAS2018]QAV70487.1 hypothetical protein ESZ53_08570 [Salinibacterium sp. UTAS2018]